MTATTLAMGHHTPRVKVLLAGSPPSPYHLKWATYQETDIVNANEKNTIGPETARLATLLGQLDATFWPFAGNRERRCIGATMELRQQWLSGKGLPCRPGGTVSQRKDTELFWKRLEAAGMVTIARAHGRRTHTKLTWAGELSIRAICGTGIPVFYWDEFLAIAAILDSTGEPSLPESFLAGAEPWVANDEQQGKLTRQQFHMLPFVAAGLLTFWHDCRACQWVSITDAGREAIATVTPTDPPDDLEVDDDVCVIYDDAYRTETARLATVVPDNPTNLFPPASAGIGWGDFASCLDRRRERLREREGSQQ